MLLEKEPLQNMYTMYGSVNAMGKGVLGYGGPQDTGFKCFWMSEMQM